MLDSGFSVHVEARHADEKTCLATHSCTLLVKSSQSSLLLEKDSAMGALS